MRYLKTYKLFESNFELVKSMIETLQDLSQDFEDNNCRVRIEPSNDIRIKVMALQGKGEVFQDINMPFYIEIDIDRRIIAPDEKRSGFGPLPGWFIESCRRIEDYMSSEGFKTLTSIRYALDWENLESIDELACQESLIYKVKLDFQKINLLSEARSDRDSSTVITYLKQLEIAEFLRDLSLELWDDNFNVQVNHTSLRNADDIVFTVNIAKRGENRFLFDVVKEIVKSMQNYMDSEGFIVDNIQVCDAAGWYDAILKDGRIFSKIFGEEIVHLISNVEISFCKIERISESHEMKIMKVKYGEQALRECDLIIDDIKDMLLELQDMGLSVGVSYTPMTLAGMEDSPKIRAEAQGDSAFCSRNKDEINSAFERIKEYARSKGYVTGFGTWERAFTKDHVIQKWLVYEILIQK